jgi:5-formyltetrahydrofolate cyclo-ligase
MHDDVTEQKRWVRSEYRRRRRMLPPLDKMGDCQASIATLIRMLERLHPGSPWPALASYMATTEEVDLGQLHALVWQRRQPVWLPRIHGPGRLAWYPIQHQDQVRIGTLNLCEPDPSLVEAQPLPQSSVMLVPGVAFGADGTRLGMGGGFYDRLLAGFPGLSIGVGFANQFCEDLPAEPHDHPVDICVLGGDIVHCRPGLRPALGLP